MTVFDALRRLAAAALALGALALVLSGFWPSRGGDPGTPGSSATEMADARAVTVNYWMWDASQAPVYRQCADDFMQLHPGIRIRITQIGWGDYWIALSTGFIADAGPDVFVNHLSRYPEHARHGILEDLSPYLRAEGETLQDHLPRLVQAWSQGGRQLGLPKDWDTVALLVNLTHARRMGVDPSEFAFLNWNPQDGGSFERMLRRLTVDRQGRSALHPAFDPQGVAVHGYPAPAPGGMIGQTEWSHWAASLGFEFQSEPWAQPYRYDDPRLAQALGWLATLPVKGLAPRPSGKGLGPAALFMAGKLALVPDGSWMVNHYSRQTAFEWAWMPLPTGPLGERATMINGVADTLWSGSKVKPQAWAWMRYLASAQCQERVAQAGVVFPSRRGLAERVVAQRRAQGLDSQAFLTMAQGRTVTMPVGPNGARIDERMGSAIEAILLGVEPAAVSLRKAQRDIDGFSR